MLETLHFTVRPSGYCPRVLGVIASQAPATHAVNFSVPAHVMGTLNMVRGGTLSLLHRDTQSQGQVQVRQLPTSFATGAHARSRRYQISAGAVLLTLFCRADALEQLCGEPACELTNCWLAAAQVFKAWEAECLNLSANRTPLEVAQAMLRCTSPSHLPVEHSAKEMQMLRLHTALQALTHHEPRVVADQLRISERSLQRLFMAQWGVSPKQVQRMLRIQRCIKLWQDQALGLADLAAQIGLTDQAHLAREFRQLVGYAPSSLKQAWPANTSGPSKRRAMSQTLLN
jgi:AraC-like DNA-binding protein